MHWSRRSIQKDGFEIVFCPVSIRFETNQSTVFMATLLSQLAKVHGDTIPWDLNSPIDVCKDVIQNYLSRPLPNGRRLLVIIDGIDEAADWLATPALFPFSLPSEVRVVVSARYLAGDVEASGWLSRLGWDQVGKATRHDLPEPLLNQAVMDVWAFVIRLGQKC